MPSSATQGSKGVVVLVPLSCRDHFVVSTSQGFALLEWYGGALPQEGQAVVGDFEKYGMQAMFNTAGQRTQIWVEDFGLSNSRVRERLARFCS